MKKFLNGISRALCVMFIYVFAGCSYAGSGDTNNNPPTEPETYTVTFDANGHGTAPDSINGKHKCETVALPSALTEK